MRFTDAKAKLLFGTNRKPANKNKINIQSAETVVGVKRSCTDMPAWSVVGA